MQSQVSSLHKSHYRQQSQIESMVQRISEEKSVEVKGDNVTLNFDSSDESDGGEKHVVKQDSCIELA